MKRVLRKSSTTSMKDDISSVTASSDDEAVAVIGIGLRIGPCRSQESFWEVLAGGRDLVCGPPAARRSDMDELARFLGYDPERIGYSDMTYLDRIDQFDSGFFNISPRQALLMDPAQRLFMEVAYQTLEDAGYGGAALRGTRTGVFVGHSAARFRYDELAFRSSGTATTQAFVGTLGSMLPSRIAYLMDLRGPAMCIDTACSSSLVAVHLAVQALRRGECTTAIAGASKVDLLPLGLDVLRETRSPDGRTRTFDDRSQGFGGGEGIIAFLLKPFAGPSGTVTSSTP